MSPLKPETFNLGLNVLLSPPPPLPAFLISSDVINVFNCPRTLKVWMGTVSRYNFLNFYDWKATVIILCALPFHSHPLPSLLSNKRLTL